MHYVVIRPSADTAMTRAVVREAPALVDPEPIEKMYREFERLGAHEHHVVDTTGHSVERDSHGGAGSPRRRDAAAVVPSCTALT